MAKHYIGIDLGKGPSTITISTSTTSKAIEVVIDDTKIKNKAQAVTLLELIEGRIATESFPPV